MSVGKRALKIVAVIGDASKPSTSATALGTWLAGRNVHLLTGGGGGTMESACDGFVNAAGDRMGFCIGVLPVDAQGNDKAGYPNKFVEIAIRTHLHAQKTNVGSGKCQRV
jgi:uncharacterized protein (TIGR00725 family)